MSTTSDSEDGEEEHWETEGPQTLEDLLMPREPADFTAEQFEETRNKSVQLRFSQFYIIRLDTLLFFIIRSFGSIDFVCLACKLDRGVF